VLTPFAYSIQPIGKTAYLMIQVYDYGR